MPREVDFIELHATGDWATSLRLSTFVETDLLGTATGDPTEANWVGECFKRDKEILVGSVKGNIGFVHYAYYADREGSFKKKLGI